MGYSVAHAASFLLAPGQDPREQVADELPPALRMIGFTATGLLLLLAA